MSQSIREFMGIGAQGIGASQPAQKKGLRETFKKFFDPENLKKPLSKIGYAASGPDIEEAFRLFDRLNDAGLTMADNPIVQQGIEVAKSAGPIENLGAAAITELKRLLPGRTAYGGVLGRGTYVPSPQTVLDRSMAIRGQEAPNYKDALSANNVLVEQILQDEYATPLFHELAHQGIAGTTFGDLKYKFSPKGGIGPGSEELPVMLSDAIYGQGGVKSDLVQSGFATPEGQITQEGVAALQGQNLPRPTMEALGMAPENPNLMSGPFQISDIQQSLLPQYQLDRRKQFEQDLADFQRNYASNMALLGGSQPVSSSGISDLYRFFDPRLNPFTTKYSGIGMNFDLPQLSSTDMNRMGFITDYSFRSPTAPTTFDPSGLQLSPGALDYFGQNYQIGM